MEVIMSEPTRCRLIIDRRTALLERTAELDDAAHGFRWPHDSHGRGSPDDEVL